MLPANMDTFSSANRMCSSTLGIRAGQARSVSLVIVLIRCPLSLYVRDGVHRGPLPDVIANGSRPRDRSVPVALGIKFTRFVPVLQRWRLSELQLRSKRSSHETAAGVTDLLLNCPRRRSEGRVLAALFTTGGKYSDLLCHGGEGVPNRSGILKHVRIRTSSRYYVLPAFACAWPRHPLPGIVVPLCLVRGLVEALLSLH